MDQSNINNYIENEVDFYKRIETYFNKSTGTFTEKLHAFPRFVPRQSISYFLARNEIFKSIINTQGSVLDFGIYRASSFFTWVQLSSIYEPYNHLRKIIGFDSFNGFSRIGEEDFSNADINLKRENGMMFPDGQIEIEENIRLIDKNRPLGHINKSKLIIGDINNTAQQYFDSHPETIVALANIGLGLYNPTTSVLEAIKGRLHKGSVLVFEDLNQENWPGETRALFNIFELNKFRLHRVPYCPHISWMTLE